MAVGGEVLPAPSKPPRSKAVLPPLAWAAGWARDPDEPEPGSTLLRQAEPLPLDGYLHAALDEAPSLPTGGRDYSKARLRLPLACPQQSLPARDTGGTLTGKKRQLSATDDSEPVSVSLCVDCCRLS